MAQFSQALKAVGAGQRYPVMRPCNLSCTVSNQDEVSLETMLRNAVNQMLAGGAYTILFLRTLRARSDRDTFATHGSLDDGIAA